MPSIYYSIHQPSYKKKPLYFITTLIEFKYPNLMCIKLHSMFFYFFLLLFFSLSCWVISCFVVLAIVFWMNIRRIRQRELLGQLGTKKREMLIVFAVKLVSFIIFALIYSTRLADRGLRNISTKNLRILSMAHLWKSNKSNM